MYDLCLRSHDHERRYVLVAQSGGWEARVEQDHELRHRRVYDDWHRVERVLTAFDREVAALMAEGWNLATVSR